MATAGWMDKAPKWARDVREMDKSKVTTPQKWAVGGLTALLLLWMLGPFATIQGELDFVAVTSTAAVSYDRAVVQHARSGTAGVPELVLVQAADSEGAVTRPVGNDRLEPSYILHIEGPRERLRVRGQRVAWGAWVFNTTLYGAGDTYRMTVFVEGDWPFYNSVWKDWDESTNDVIFDWPPHVRNVYAYDFKLHRPSRLSSVGELFDDRIQRLPPCAPRHGITGARLQGRWVSPHLISDRAMLAKLVPEREAQGSQSFYVPDQCLIYYTSAEAARKCLRGKEYLSIGDSVAEELAVDLGMHLHDLDDRPEPFEPFMGKSTECSDEGNKRYRMLHWPMKNATLGLDTKVSMVWGGHAGVCANGEGLRSFTHKGVNNRLYHALLNSSSIMDLPLDGDATPDVPILKDLETSIEQRWGNRPTTLAPEQKMDFALVSAGLHDFIQARFHNINLTQLVNMYDAHLADVVRYSNRVFVHLINPKMPAANEIVRQTNEAIVEMARKHHVTVLDAFSIQEMRMNDRVEVLDGDQHHSSKVIFEGRRSPFLHANTQTLLHFICQDV